MIKSLNDFNLEAFYFNNLNLNNLQNHQNLQNSSTPLSHQINYFIYYLPKKE